MGEPQLLDTLKQYKETLDETHKLVLLSREEGDKERATNKEKLEKIDGKASDNLVKLDEYRDTLKKLEERQEKIEALANTAGKSVDETEEKRGEIASMFDSFMRKQSGNQLTFGMDLKEKKPELYTLCLKDKYPTMSMEEIEKKGLSVDSDIDGGFLVQNLIMPILKTRVFETSNVRAIANVVTISTNALQMPIDDDEAESGGYVGERQLRPNTNTPRIREAMIPVQEQFANPTITQTLLDDAAFDVSNWLAGKIADIFMRTENTKFVNGTGAGAKEPRGFMTYPAAAGSDFEVNAIEQIPSLNANEITTDGIIELQGSLKEDYQMNATFVMNRRTFTKILRLKNLQGDYLWNRALDKNVQVPFDLLGRPVRFFNDMPLVGTDTLPIAYGDFKKAFWIVDRMGMRVLRDPFTAKPFIQFFSTKRNSSDILNFEALKIQKVTT